VDQQPSSENLCWTVFFQRPVKEKTFVEHFQRPNKEDEVCFQSFDLLLPCNGSDKGTILLHWPQDSVGGKSGVQRKKWVPYDWNNERRRRWGRLRRQWGWARAARGTGLVQISRRRIEHNWNHHFCLALASSPVSPEASVVSWAFAPVVSKRKKNERNVIFILSSKTLSMTTQTSLLFLTKCFNVLLHSVLTWDKVMSFQSQQIITFQSQQNCITAKTTFVLSSSLTKTIKDSLSRTHIYMFFASTNKQFKDIIILVNSIYCW